MPIERIATLIASGVGSAAGFYVITQSGLAGTLVGASVAAVVYVGTAQWLAPGVEKGAHLIQAKTLRRRPEEDVPFAVGFNAGEYEEGGEQSAAAGETRPGTDERGDASAGPRKHGALRRRAVTWMPAAFAVLALVVSVYALQGHEPLERVIFREKVVEKPVVTERVVVERETVTVTVPVYVEGNTSADSATTTTESDDAAGAGTTSGTATTSSTSTTSTTTPPTSAGGEESSSTTTAAPPTTAPSTTSGSNSVE